MILPYHIIVFSIFCVQVLNVYRFPGMSMLGHWPLALVFVKTQAVIVISAREYPHGPRHHRVALYRLSYRIAHAAYTGSLNVNTYLVQSPMLTTC